MKNTFLPFFISCFYIGFSQPSNDQCTNAIATSIASNKSQCNFTTASTVNASNSSEFPDCYESAEVYIADVWYRFTASTEYIELSIQNKSLSNKPVGYSLYSNNCASLIDIFCGSDSAKFNGLNIGQEYFLQLFYDDSLAFGTFDFCLSSFTNNNTAANDECKGAINYTVQNNTSSCIPTNVSLNNSNPSGVYGSCIGSGANLTGDVWYKFTAISTQVKFFFDNGNGSASNGIHYQLYLKECSDFTTNTETNSLCSFISNQMFGVEDFSPSSLVLTIGKTYYIRFFANDTVNQSGNFDFCIIPSGVLSVNESIDDGLKIYPNPTNDVFYVALPEHKTISNVKAYNVVGEEINVNFSSNMVSVEKLSRGIYKIEIILDNNEKLYEKLIIN